MDDREAEILKALESLSSDDLRFIWKTCADILSSRKDYLKKWSTDDD